MKVGIQVKEGRLILIWNNGKRRIMAIDLPDSKAVRSLAKKTVAKIGIDFHHGDGYYDRTFLKCKPRTIGKIGTEISRVELFDRISKDRFKEKALVQFSIAAGYKPIERMLEKHLNIQSAKMDRRGTEVFADVRKALKFSTTKARIWLLRSGWNWAKGQCEIAAENLREDISARFKRDKSRSPICFTESEKSLIPQEFRSSS